MDSMPSFGQVTIWKEEEPERIWIDEEEREYGVLEVGQDALHQNDEEWWIRLPRWSKDPEIEKPRPYETLYFPRTNDILRLKNLKTGKMRKARVVRFPERVVRKQRLVRIVLENIIF
jgi:hypothetical protein